MSRRQQVMIVQTTRRRPAGTGGSGWLHALVAVVMFAGVGWVVQHDHMFASAGTGPAQASVAAAHGGKPAATPDPLAGAATAVAFAESQVGHGYVWSGNGQPGDCGPAGGCYDWDCSGLVTAAWAKAGKTIPRSTQTEWAGLRRTSDLEPGVLILYRSPPAYPGEKQPGHVAIYAGHGQMVEAYDIDVGVRKTPVRKGWMGLAVPLAR